MSNWTPRPALTENELKNLISSVTDYIKPTTPCARHKETLSMRSLYIMKYGAEALKEDYEKVQAVLRSYNESKNNRG